MALKIVEETLNIVFIISFTIAAMLLVLKFLNIDLLNVIIQMFRMRL